MAKATAEELTELREMLPGLEAEAELSAADNDYDRRRQACDQLRYVRWRLRGGDPETAERGAPTNPFQDQE